MVCSNRKEMTFSSSGKLTGSVTVKMLTGICGSRKASTSAKTLRRRLCNVIYIVKIKRGGAHLDLLEGATHTVTWDLLQS